MYIYIMDNTRNKQNNDTFYDDRCAIVEDMMFILNYYETNKKIMNDTIEKYMKHIQPKKVLSIKKNNKKNNKKLD